MVGYSNTTHDQQNTEGAENMSVVCISECNIAETDTGSIFADIFLRYNYLFDIINLSQ